MRKVKVIGLGGIGTALLPFLCRYLNAAKERWRITVIDGDEYEEKNAARQLFGRYGNKAKIKTEEIAKEFRNLSVRAVEEFVTKKNIEEIIEEGDIVFLAVDNHQTRKLVAQHCEELEDIVLISGGNELTDGNVQLYIKERGEPKTFSITKFHPELQTPTDKNPGEMSCEEKAEQPSSRQIIFTNMMVAAWMLSTFWLIEQKMIKEARGELYFDIVRGGAQRIKREEEALWELS